MNCADCGAGIHSCEDLYIDQGNGVLDDAYYHIWCWDEEWHDHDFDCESRGLMDNTSSVVNDDM
jgi:hypothetical protein